MSWSLGIKGGDLALSGNSFSQVTGSAKIVQDIRCAIIEEMGTDDMHRSFGSIIDGGIDQYGNVVPSIIGETDWDYINLKVEAELRRIATEHQARQAQRAKTDRLRYGESTLRSDEIIIEVSKIDLVQVQDKLLATMFLVTGNGQEYTINVPITNFITITQ